MIVYAATDYYKKFVPLLISAHPGIVAGEASIDRFTNGEMHATVEGSVKDELCLIIGTTAPPDEQLCRLLTLANAIKRGGARHIRAFLPYLGYARQDKFAPGESGGINLVGALLRAAGIDEVITVDAHSDLDRKLIGLPLVSLSPAQLFAPITQRPELKDATIVAPDTGAIARSQMLASTIGSIRPITYMIKKRTYGITHEEVVGKVNSKVILVDDIIDTGSTIISACKTLQQHGAKEIVALVTHGLFSSTDWDQLFTYGVTEFYVTDSCPEAVQIDHPNVHLVSLAPLLPAVVRRIAKKEVSYEYAIA